MTRPPIQLWWPVAAVLAAALGFAAGAVLLARALHPPSLAASASILASLPSVTQNRLLHEAYGKEAVTPADVFTELRLRARTAGESEANDALADSLHSIAGNSRAVVACGVVGRRPLCLARDGEGAWRENTPAWLSGPADRIDPSAWRLFSDDVFIYLFHIAVIRLSPERHG